MERAVGSTFVFERLVLHRSRAFPKCRLSMNAESYADAPGIPFFSVELFIQLQAIAGFRNRIKNAQSRKYSERFV